mgnify:FL=1
MAEDGTGGQPPDPRSICTKKKQDDSMADWRDLQQSMADHGYIAGDDLVMALHIALSLGRPLLLEGAAGVGKTEEIGRAHV